MQIEKYSFGTGDRFGKEGSAQLAALLEINRLGVPVAPVWNKSNREHAIIHTVPEDVTKEAAAAVAAAGYKGSYYVDADHINLETVDKFMAASNFFTIDVAHFIGKKADPDAVQDFSNRYGRYIGELTIPGISRKLMVTRDFLVNLAENYLAAIQEVRKIYDRICEVKGKENFVAEVSVDEAELVQGPLELFFILAMLRDQNVEVQTIAPKFSGLFAKGVDYIGNVNDFAAEFEQDVAVLQFAIQELGMAPNLKLSVHSGSDKFSIYPAICSALRKFNAGIHVKTAGTTWLEEVIGLAEAGGDGLDIAKAVYAGSLVRFEELTAPYATVLKIDPKMLPEASEVNQWNSRQFSEALTHNQQCAGYNPHFRQLIHVGYKIAVEMGEPFRSALDKHHTIIAEKVKYNLLERHLKPLFL
ncbi:MAG: tagaturonate epimerase family protein [Bacteroidales bacterium]